MSKDPYSHLAGVFDILFEPMNRGLRLIGRAMYRPTKGMKILDVGCGTGTHLELYQKYDCALHGIDTSESMMQRARKRLNGTADLRLADACKIPFDDRTFDLVISMLMLHEMDESIRPRVLEEMKRVVKPDGRILLIDFHIGPYRFFQGWLTKTIIFVSEIIAGRKHFRNYRHFMSVRGLSPLLAEAGLSIEQEKVVGGGGLV
ncbi:MAG: methyltransferase domain-containing protein, partial [Bacteroidota bacterium]